MKKEITNSSISKEKLLLLVIRAEKYKSKPCLKATYDILDEKLDEPIGNTESLLRYIPGDPKDSFEVILN